MKSSLLSTFLTVGIPLACNGAVLPRNDPNGTPIKPDRPLSADGVTRATARFGPFKLPSNKVSGAMGQSGMMMQNVYNVAMPCQGCTYTYLRSDMVYKNGSSANIENGAYMHHSTLVAGPVGGGSWSQVISGIGGALEESRGQGPSKPSPYKPVYMTGNERLAVTYPNAGVYLAKTQAVLLTVLLENLEDDQKEVFIDMDYDYVMGQPEGYLDIVPVSQDALGLMGMLGGIQQKGTWTKTSNTYRVGQKARILMMYGHVHDGGIHTEILVNDKVRCDSIAYYQGMKIPDGSSMQMQGHNGGPSSTPKVPEQNQRSIRAAGDNVNSHIVNFGECKEVGTVEKGDGITTKVYYDFPKRPATLLANGKEDPMMGISMTYLGIPMVKE